MGNEGEIRLLHVDDDPDLAVLTADMLEREDDRFNIRTAANAGDALDRLADAEYDCIVSDYDMPGRNGIEFLETVREEHPDLPFILYTGKGSEEVASDAVSAGVTEYLQKESGTDHYALLANRIGNVVESYRSQRRLAERNEDLRRYKRMINAMNEAACIYDADGRFEIVNEYLADWYNTTREALTGRQSNLIPSIREQSADGDPYQALLDGRRDQLSGEIEVEFPDHGYGVLEYRLTPIVVDGAIEGTVGVARDITEERERQRERERTNALLSTLFDALPQGILVEDASRSVLTVNEQMFDLFDLPGSPAGIVGEDCERMAEAVGDAFADSGRFVERTDERIAETERDPVDVEELGLADGRTLERTHRPIELPDGGGHLWMYRDITERTVRERQLKALNQVTQQLMSADTRDEVLDIGVETTRDLLGIEVNAIHLYDDDAEGLVPRAATDAVYDLIGDPPVFTGDDSIAWRVYRRGEPLAVDDTHENANRYNPDTPVRSELHLPLGEYGILIAGSPSPETFDDEDVLMGEILAGGLTTALEQVERTEQLRTRERELTERNDRLEEFASIVSHDLRNPLTVAEGRLDLAAAECDSEHLDRVERAHDRMRALIEDLLLLAREGEAGTDVEPVALAPLVTGCWANVETDAARLVTDTDRTVRADESRLKQLFENLMRNAVEHGDGRPTVTVGELDDGFYVEDDGPGIPADERESVFAAGYSTSDDGTGFGLSIVEQIAKTHGWDVRVTEGREGGARFEITGVEFAAE